METVVQSAKMGAILKKLTGLLYAHSKDEQPFLMALDGRCAAGKTTLAAAIQKETGCQLFHMDDFFLRPEQRTPKRLAEPGGNVDWERFLSEVLVPVRQGKAAVYRPYDCQTGELCPPLTAKISPMVLVEGSYCCHPALWEQYDLRVFLTVEPREQQRRIRARNGEAGLNVFRERWIPLEERYFAAFDVQNRCELCFSTEE